MAAQQLANRHNDSQLLFSPATPELTCTVRQVNSKVACARSLRFAVNVADATDRSTRVILQGMWRRNQSPVRNLVIHWISSDRVNHDRRGW
jgi:hypothetical protein